MTFDMIAKVTSLASDVSSVAGNGSTIYTEFSTRKANRAISDLVEDGLEITASDDGDSLIMQKRDKKKKSK